MWRIVYNQNEKSDDSFYTLTQVTSDGEKEYAISNGNIGTPYRPLDAFSGTYDADDIPKTIAHESKELNVETKYNTTKVNGEPKTNGSLPSNGLSTISSHSLSDTQKSDPNLEVIIPTPNNSLHSRSNAVRKQIPWQEETVLPNQTTPALEDDYDETKKKDTEDQEKLFGLLYGNQKRIFWAVVVRLLLIGHNVMTVWRTVEACNEPYYWLITLANLLLLLELHVVIVRRAGVDFSWWTPCFFVYLSSTIPAIWLLQLQIHEDITNPSPSPSSAALAATTPSTLATTSTTSATTTTTDIFNTTANLTGSTVDLATNVTTSILVTLFNSSTESIGTSTLSSNSSTGSWNESTTSLLNSSTTSSITGSTAAVSSCQNDDDLERLLTLDNNVWAIIIQESLIYLIVFCRWLLPRGKVSRAFLADLLLEFLGIASDIMELLAIFELDEVRRDLTLNILVMSVWSASFIQFIPVLVQKQKYRHITNPRVACITRVFGDGFIEFLVTCMSILLQDGPFLVVRLFIIIKVRVITYSLIFFVTKNFVTLLLLFYRLVITVRKFPACRRCRKQKV